MQQVIKAKIVTLGDYEVGKSSLIQRYVKNDFTEARFQTQGAEFTPKQILRQNRLIELQIWDTAGQEVYRSIAKLYYQNAQFAILVYDVTKKNSLQVIKFWIEELNKEGLSDLTKFIVANKIDLESVVPIEEVKEYANSFNPKIEVFQTSCKENIGVFELFNHIGDIVYEREKSLQKKDVVILQQKPKHDELEESCC